MVCHGPSLGVRREPATTGRGRRLFRLRVPQHGPPVLPPETWALREIELPQGDSLRCSHTAVRQRGMLEAFLLRCIAGLVAMVVEFLLALLVLLVTLLVVQRRHAGSLSFALPDVHRGEGSYLMHLGSVQRQEGFLQGPQRLRRPRRHRRDGRLRRHRRDRRLRQLRRHRKERLRRDRRLRRHPRRLRRHRGDRRLRQLRRHRGHQGPFASRFAECGLKRRSCTRRFATGRSLVL